MSDITSVPKIGLSMFCNMLEIALADPKIKAHLPPIESTAPRMTPQGIDNFAQQNGMLAGFPVVSTFPRAFCNETLLCHPVSDCMVATQGTLLPLHKYISELDVSSLAGSQKRFRRILLPLAEVGNFGVTVGGYMLPLLNTASRLLDAKRAHWALLEIQYGYEDDIANESRICNKLKVIVHDSKPAIVSSGLYFTSGAYPVKNYLRDQFKSEEMCKKLGALFGGSPDRLKSPDISVNAYGVQALSNNTECGHHMLVTTLALLQERTYAEVLSDLGGSLSGFYGRCQQSMPAEYLQAPASDAVEIDSTGFKMTEVTDDGELVPARLRPR